MVTKAQVDKLIKRIEELEDFKEFVLIHERHYWERRHYENWKKTGHIDVSGHYVKKRKGYLFG